MSRGVRLDIQCICAAVAAWGECDDRGKPEVPINRVLNQCAPGRSKVVPFLWVSNVQYFWKYVQFCQNLVFVHVQFLRKKSCTCTIFEPLFLIFVDECCTCTTFMLRKLYMYNFECRLFEIRCTTRCTVLKPRKRGSRLGVRCDCPWGRPPNPANFNAERWKLRFRERIG